MMAAKVWVREPMHCYASEEERAEYSDGTYELLRYATGSDYMVDQCSKTSWERTRDALALLLEGKISCRGRGICHNYGKNALWDRRRDCRLQYLFAKVAPRHSLAYPIGGCREYSSDDSLWDGEKGEARMEMLTALITQCEIEIAACDLAVCDWEDWRDEQ